MRNWLAVGVVGVGLAMVGSLVVGCSGATPVASLSDFCTQKATLECQYVAGTPTSPGVCAGLTSQTCISYRTNLCITDGESATASGQREFNPGNIKACLTAISTAYGDLTYPTDESLSYASISGGPGDTMTVDYICESVFQGSVQSMGTCTSPYDCASPNVCTPANGGAKIDVCAPLVQVADGDSCGGAGSVCVTGDDCVVDKSTGEYVCQASTANLGGLNAPCKTDADCDPTVAGFCDIYAPKPTCQAGYNFGLGYDCQAYGGSKPAG